MKSKPAVPKPYSFFAGIFAFILLLFCIFVLLSPAALACGGCGEYYPWMHSFPTDEELNEATKKFLAEYSSASLQNKRDAAIAEMWYLMLESPGIDGQDGIKEVVLCIKEEVNEKGMIRNNYFYTMISYAEERGFFFWPYIMSSFNDREKFDRYIEEYVMGRPRDKKLVGLVEASDFEGLQNVQSLGISGAFGLKTLLIALGLGFITLTIGVKAGKRNGKGQ